MILSRQRHSYRVFYIFSYGERKSCHPRSDVGKDLAVVKWDAEDNAAEQKLDFVAQPYVPIVMNKVVQIQQLKKN